MGCLIAEIACLVLGIVALATGKINLTSNLGFVMASRDGCLTPKTYKVPW